MIDFLFRKRLRLAELEFQRLRVTSLLLLMQVAAESKIKKQEYEYFVGTCTSNSPGEMNAWLSGFARDGWRLMCVVREFYYFERRLRK